MTKRPSSDGNRGRFDAFRLARERGQLDGTVDAATLPRVADTVLDGAAPIAWRIEGTQDALGRPALAVALDGDGAARVPALPAGAFDVAGAHEHSACSWRVTTPILRGSTPTATHEVVLADAPLDPAQLVEDELVLALPYAPRHADGECERRRKGGRAECKRWRHRWK